jgi:hypothetical protein
MTGEERLHEIDDLIAHSSLGADGVDQIAARTSDDTLAAILRRKTTEEQLDAVPLPQTAGLRSGGERR